MWAEQSRMTSSGDNQQNAVIVKDAAGSSHHIISLPSNSHSETRSGDPERKRKSGIDTVAYVTEQSVAGAAQRPLISRRRSSSYLEQIHASVVAKTNPKSNEPVPKRRESLADKLGMSEDAWCEALESVATDERWLHWVTSQFKAVAGDDHLIDKAEFKQALGIKDVSIRS